VSLDTGMSIEWAPDKDGSIEYGMEVHRREEAEFLSRIDAATPAIEVLVDELESSGHSFTPPTNAAFAQQAQHGEHGSPIVTVSIACTPQLSRKALANLVERVARLLGVEG
jgi:hypothetical protein